MNVDLRMTFLGRTFVKTKQNILLRDRKYILEIESIACAVVKFKTQIEWLSNHLAPSDLAHLKMLYIIYIIDYIE